jgi:hypothetical protein
MKSKDIILHDPDLAKIFASVEIRDQSILIEQNTGARSSIYTITGAIKISLPFRLRGNHTFLP